MPGRKSPGLVAAWLWASLVVATSVVVGIALMAQSRFEVDVLLFVLAAVAYSYLGLLLFVRRPGNRLAWLLFVVATWVAVTGLTQLRPVHGSSPPDPVAVWDILSIMWGNTGYFVGLLLPLVLFLYLFPTGRFLTRRWSWAGWVVGVIAPIALATQLFAVDVGPSDGDWTVANPFGFLGGNSLDEGVIGLIFGLGFTAMAVGAIPAIVVRYRRADTIARTQIKWVVYAGLLMFGSVFMNIASESVLPDWISSLSFVVLLLAVPVSVTVAITRYKLFEIDRIISRTVSYAVVVFVLGATYFGLVTLLTSLLPSQNALAVAGSTLAVASMFNPMRKRIRKAVDRRFNRSASRAENLAEAFAVRLRESPGTEELIGLWNQVVVDTFHPDVSGLWLNETRTQPKTQSTST